MTAYLRTAFSRDLLSSIFSALRIPYSVLILFFAFHLTPLFAATGERAMVVTPDHRATQAALDVLKQGGNAVDAAVVAGWVMNVVSPQSSGIGGSGLFLFYDIGTRRILSFDGSVKAPAKATPGMFLDARGKPLPYQPERNTGGLPVGVPGLLKMAEGVHAKYGTHKFPFAQLFEPAILLAEKGTEVSGELSGALRENAERLILLDPTKALFFKEGIPLGTGEKFQQPDLVKAFRLIQKKGSSAFYNGAIATEIVRDVQKNKFRPGVLEDRDLEDYAAAEREPLHATYQSYDLFSAAPPADGGVMLFRALNVLSHFAMPGLGKSAEAYHLLGETQNVAFAYRGGVVDPDLFDIPLKELLSGAWAQERAGDIKFDQVIHSAKAVGQETGSGTGKKHSGISIMVVDTHGNIAILVATLGDAFGSGLRVPGYGFFLNNLLTDFDVDPSSGSSAGMVSGGQRPRGTESPVLMFKDGKPAVMANAYGPEDPAAVLLNVIVPRIDLGASCSEALEFPRVLERGDTLREEKGLYAQEMIRLKLELLGHKIEKEDAIGLAQMVCFDPGSGKIEGESDARGEGEAAGF